MLSQLTGRMVRDLLCHKGDVAFADPGDWSFRDWLLWDRAEHSITHNNTASFPEELPPSPKASKNVLQDSLVQEL